MVRFPPTKTVEKTTSSIEKLKAPGKTDPTVKAYKAPATPLRAPESTCSNIPTRAIFTPKQAVSSEL
jgi:hypothetical protein